MVDEQKSKDDLLEEVNVLHKQIEALRFQVRMGAEGDARKVRGEGMAPKSPGASFHESEGKYRALIETTDTGFVIIDFEGRVLSANEEYVRVSGHARLEEIVGRSVIEWTAPHDRERNENALVRCVREGKVRNLELDYVGKDGGIVEVEMNATVVVAESGVEILGVCRDISARKHAERELRDTKARYEELIERMDEGLAMADEDFRFTFVNRRMSEMLATTRDKLLGRAMIDFVDENDRHMMEEQQAKRRHGDEESYEVAWRTSDDKVIYTLVNPRGFYDKQGVFLGGFAVVTDMTEHKRAQEALRQSELSYRTIFDSASDAIFVHDPKTGRVVEVNEAACQIWGCSREELKASDLARLSFGLPPFTREDAMEWMRKAVEEGPQSFEWISRRGDGTRISFENSVKCIAIGGKERVLVVGRDITERKLAEDALRESEARYRRVVEAMGEGLAITSSDFRFTFVNRALCEMLEYGREDLLGRSVRDFVHEDCLATLEINMEERRRGIEEAYELGWKSRGGKMVYTLITPTVFYDERGNFSGALGLVRDISERKQVEEALQESELKYRTLFESSHDAIMILDREVFIDGNPAAVRMFGCSWRDDFISRHPAALSPPQQSDGRDSYAVAHGHIERAMEKGYDFFPWVHRRHDGTVFPTEITLSRLEYKGKTLLQAIARDVSERERALEALRESEERFRMLISKSADAFLLIDEGRFVDCNQAALDLMGASSREQLLPLTPSDLSPELQPDGRLSSEKANEILGQIAVGGSRRFEWVHRRIGGEDFPVEVLLTCIPMGGKKFVHTVWRDISERKGMEEALRESEERFRELSEAAFEGIMISHEGTLVNANSRFFEMFGCSSEDFAGRNILEFVAPECQELATRRIEEGLLDQDELVALRSDGTRFPVEVQVRTMRHKGLPVRVTAIRDITDRKKAEEQLRDKNLDLEQMNAALKVLLGQRDKDRTEMEERILFNLKEMVEPFLRRLMKSGLNDTQSSYVGVVESNLRDIVSPFGQRLSLTHLNLTVTEMQIANLIRQGRSTKEIGDILNLSPKTVETHRRNIREKVNIVNRKVNLRAYLVSLERGSRRAV